MGTNGKGPMLRPSCTECGAVGSISFVANEETGECGLECLECEAAYMQQDESPLYSLADTLADEQHGNVDSPG